MRRHFILQFVHSILGECSSDRYPIAECLHHPLLTLCGRKMCQAAATTRLIQLILRLHSSFSSFRLRTLVGTSSSLCHFAGDRRGRQEDQRVLLQLHPPAEYGWIVDKVLNQKIESAAHEYCFGGCLVLLQHLMFVDETREK